MAQTCTRPLFCCRDPDINQETQRWPTYSEDVPSHRKWSCYVKAFKAPNRRWHVHGKWTKYENSSQSQKLRSNVTNLQSLLAFAMGHITTKLHQFLISSFRDFVQTDRRMDRQTDRRRQKQYLLAAHMQVMTIINTHISSLSKQRYFIPDAPVHDIFVLQFTIHWLHNAAT